MFFFTAKRTCQGSGDEHESGLWSRGLLFRAVGGNSPVFPKRNGDKNRETKDWSKKDEQLRMKNRRKLSMRHSDLAVKDI